MNKDVIYIDVEDDITAIIGKVKASKEKIVALVPPKRIGVLQSAVNLHLLVRMTKNAQKQLVLVTNNQALISLAAAAAIPVAKNLQSKPELAVIPALAVDEGEDIIDGAQLPEDDLAGTTGSPGGAPLADKIPVMNNLADEIDVDGEEAVAPIMAAATAPKRALPPKRSNIKVPNFSKFRKRLFLGILGLVVLIGVIVWATVFAPAATVVITAKTIPTPISQTVTLGTAPTNVSSNTIQAITQTLQKTVSVKFTPTGTEDLGNKATGTVKLSALSQSSTDVPSGTVLTTADGLNFVTQADATVPASVACFPSFCAQSTTVGVQAQSAGTNYNGETGSLTGAPSGVSATFTPSSSGGSAATSGGTSNVQTVVSASDIATATTALNALSTDADKKQLFSQFSNGQHIISASFNVSRATPTSSPALNAQASGNNGATLSSVVTYTVQGLAPSDIQQFLDSALKQQINGQTDQRVYDDGISKVVLAGYNNDNGPATINIAATGQVGPNINVNTVKSQAEGKKSGEVQAELENISGVSDAEVKFSFPWVTTVPKNPSKVDVQFNLTNG